MGDFAIGIDLGTSNTVAACVNGHRPMVLSDENGFQLQASVASFVQGGEAIVGNAAKPLLTRFAERSIVSSKRLMGRPIYSPEASEAQRRSLCPIVESAGRSCAYEIDGKHFAPEEIAARLLARMAQISAQRFGQPATQAVITVPANFREAQRSATKRAGTMAGLDVLRLLNEPTAAALAYGFDRDPTRQLVAIYDLGGGTFDITILEQRGQVFEVRATAGDSFLGGDDIDEKIAEAIAGAFTMKVGHNPRSNLNLWQRLRLEAEKLKCKLSQESRVRSIIETPMPDNRQVKVQFDLTRDTFNSWAEPIIRRTLVTCDEALRLAGIQSHDINQLVLVGGSTRIPLLREMVASYFFQDPLIGIDPDCVVAIGAAIYAESLNVVSYGDALGEADSKGGTNPSMRPFATGGFQSMKPLEELDEDTVTIEHLGESGDSFDDLDELFEIHATEDEETSVFKLSHEQDKPSQAELPSALSPAPAAASQPAPPQPKFPLLIDVTSHAIGIETLGGVFEEIIPRNQKVPTQRLRAFTTSHDNQNKVRLKIFEGSQRIAKENHKLGELTLSGLRPAPKGQVKIDLTLALDTNAMLQVEAVDADTNQQAKCLLEVAGLAPNSDF